MQKIIANNYIANNNLHAQLLMFSRDPWHQHVAMVEIHFLGFSPQLLVQAFTPSNYSRLSLYVDIILNLYIALQAGSSCFITG